MPLDPAKIKAIIATLGVSQAEVARRADMSAPALNQVLSGGRTDPRLSTAERIAGALRRPLKEILA